MQLTNPLSVRATPTGRRRRRGEARPGPLPPRAAARDRRVRRGLARRRTSGSSGRSRSRSIPRAPLAAPRAPSARRSPRPGSATPAIVTLYEAGERRRRRLPRLRARPRAHAGRAARRTGALSDRDVVRIGLALCDALEHAHAHGVVHRDVKPQNVMVPDGPTAAGVAKLTDFGIAQLAGDEPLTRTGDVVGTLAYMAPEQAEGGARGPAADVYALGARPLRGARGRQPGARAPAPAATARRLGAAAAPAAPLAPRPAGRACARRSTARCRARARPSAATLWELRAALAGRPSAERSTTTRDAAARPPREAGAVRAARAAPARRARCAAGGCSPSRRCRRRAARAPPLPAAGQGAAAAAARARAPARRAGWPPRSAPWRGWPPTARPGARGPRGAPRSPSLRSLLPRAGALWSVPALAPAARRRAASPPRSPRSPAGRAPPRAAPRSGRRLLVGCCSPSRRRDIPPRARLAPTPPTGAAHATSSGAAGRERGDPRARRVRRRPRRACRGSCAAAPLPLAFAGAGAVGGRRSPPPRRRSATTPSLGARHGPRSSPSSQRVRGGAARAAPSDLAPAGGLGLTPTRPRRTADERAQEPREQDRRPRRGRVQPAFRSEVRPVEIARKLAQGDGGAQDVSVSRVYVPNEYAVYLSREDRERFDGYETRSVKELVRVSARACPPREARAARAPGRRVPHRRPAAPGRVRHPGPHGRARRGGAARPAAARASVGHTMIYSAVGQRGRRARSRRAAAPRGRRCCSFRGQAHGARAARRRSSAAAASATSCSTTRTSRAGTPPFSARGREAGSSRTSARRTACWSTAGRIGAAQPLDAGRPHRAGHDRAHASRWSSRCRCSSPSRSCLKFGFLAVLYLFLLWVARSALQGPAPRRRRHGRAAQPADATGMHAAAVRRRARAPVDYDPRLVVERVAGAPAGSEYELARRRGARPRRPGGHPARGHVRLLAPRAARPPGRRRGARGPRLDQRHATSTASRCAGPQPLHPGDRIRIGDSEFSYAE